MGANDVQGLEGLREVTLDDKYLADSGHVFLTGIQALVRLPLLQRQRDRAAGLRTAGYISGYRGSPLGTYDEQLRKAKKLLVDSDVIFNPGVNEDLAATAIWGTQQAGALGEGKYQGVFGIWYGKGPGVDRSGDVLRHGNLAGSSRHGGVLVLAGDDHTCESSTTCHQSEFALMDSMLPVLSPSGVQELIEFGLLGLSMSRHSGCWVGMKCVKDTADASAVVDLDSFRPPIEPNVATSGDGLHLRLPDTPHAQEFRLHNYKLEAVKAFARANGIDKLTRDCDNAWFGVATHGKSFLDVMQAFEDLGLRDDDLDRFGVRVYKVGMTWPLEAEGARAFAEGLEEILVVEEKRSLIEFQIKDALYGGTRPPRISGKQDLDGRKQFAAEMALDSAQIAVVIADKLLDRMPNEALRARRDVMAARLAPATASDVMQRSFYFCSGCPHNTSTVLPDGSRGYAGIGCGWMSQMMDRNTLGYTHMGGEGVAWVGEAPFSTRGHVFQNIGDGTYFHSGSLAIRAAVASGTNITYKILFNDAVAMTGGQRHDGELTPQRITWQMFAEGVRRICVVTDDPGKYARKAPGAHPDAIEANIVLDRDSPSLDAFAPGVTIHHRDTLDAVQKQLCGASGVSVLIYDQTCAAEKRRRRKRGTFPDPAKRLFINELVCEGCGDCGSQSNCVSLVPVETPFGRKRAIDQSSCNKDYSCLKGFCPSFVTVRGGRLKRQVALPADDRPLVEPELPVLDGIYSMVVTGVGGTGIVTIGAILGMAAHLEGKGCGLLDMAGLAQKGGSVWSHLRIAAAPGMVKATRVAPGGADLILGCDLVVTTSAKTMGLVHGGTAVVVNTHEVMPGHFARMPDMKFEAGAMLERLDAAIDPERLWVVDATRLATERFGDAMATNMFLLGYAYQRGLIPVGSAAIERAIELNGVSIELNRSAFRQGRQVGDTAVSGAATAPEADPRASTLDHIIDARHAFLVQYQDTAYADRYAALVLRVRHFESERFGKKTALSEAVARYYFKLLAYKDEYEVARLYASSDFLERIKAQFEGDAVVEFNLAPPVLSSRDSNTGHPTKRAFGSWMLWVFRALAAARRLRGTRWDPFGRTEERRAERGLIQRYEASIEAILANGRLHNHEVLVELASMPEGIRGYGHVKQRHIESVMPEWERVQAQVLKSVIAIHAV